VLGVGIVKVGFDPSGSLLCLYCVYIKGGEQSIGVFACRKESAVVVWGCSRGLLGCVWSAFTLYSISRYWYVHGHAFGFVFQSLF